MKFLSNKKYFSVDYANNCLCKTLQCIAREIYILCLKKVHPFYFCDYSVKR